MFMYIGRRTHHSAILGTVWSRGWPLPRVFPLKVSEESLNRETSQRVVDVVR